MRTRQYVYLSVRDEVGRARAGFRRWEEHGTVAKIVGGAQSVFFFQAEDGIRDLTVTGVQTCALPIYDVQPVVEDARAGQPIRQSEEHEAILRVRVGLPLADQLEGGGLAVRGRELGVLERALEHEGGGRAARSRHAHSGPVGLGDAGDRRAGTNEVGDVDDDVGRRIVDHRSPRRIDGENRDIPGAGLCIVHQAGDRRVLDGRETHARVGGQCPAEHERRPRELAGLAVLAGDDGIAGEEGGAELTPRRQLRLDGRARRGEPARTAGHERDPDDARDDPRRPHRRHYGLKTSMPTITTLPELLFSAQCVTSRDSVMTSPGLCCFWKPPSRISVSVPSRMYANAGRSLWL